MNLETKNSNDTTVVSNSSVFVIEKSRYENLLKSGENILSYFLLSSDLKGTIESPSAYFAPNSLLDIDDVMLTHGWRNYKYSKPRGKLNHIMEKGISLSGVINVKNSKAKKETIDLMLTAFDSDQLFYTTKTTVPGSFEFKLNDLYGDHSNILIEPVNTSEKEKSNYNLTINKKSPTKVQFEPDRKVIVRDSSVLGIVEKNRAQKQIQDKYFEGLSGITELDEVVVEAYKMTPERKKMFDKYGKADTVIEGKEIEEEESDWSFGLYSVLQFKFRDRITVIRNAQGDLEARSIVDGRDHVTLVLVDGVPIRVEDYFSIQHIDVSEVKSVEIIDYPKESTLLYKRVYPTALPPYPNVSILAIYTKSGKGLYSAIKPQKKIKMETIPVFSVQKEFYVPKYKAEHHFDYPDPDFRSTIFWKPQLISSNNEKSVVSYNHSDDEGQFVMIIESITNQGQIGYTKIEYSVKSDQDN